MMSSATKKYDSNPSESKASNMGASGKARIFLPVGTPTSFQSTNAKLNQI